MRPDRHVAWRMHNLPADPIEALRDALASVLARPVPARV
ncbi:hypothetical protein [Mammaliicoccus sciuri]